MTTFHQPAREIPVAKAPGAGFKYFTNATVRVER